MVDGDINCVLVHQTNYGRSIIDGPIWKVDEEGVYLLNENGEMAWAVRIASAAQSAPRSAIAAQ